MDSDDDFWMRWLADGRTFAEIVREGIVVELPAAESEAPVLPRLPPGYYWHRNSGGVTSMQTVFFQVWSPELGYPPVWE